MNLTIQRLMEYMSSRWTKIPCLIVSLVLLCLPYAYAAEIRLAWESEADVSGYKIYYGHASGHYVSPIDVGNVTSYTLDLPGKKSYIALTAYDAYGNESGFSNEVSWPIQVFAPAEEEIIFSGSSYTIAWYGAADVSSFDLYYSTDAGVAWVLIDDQVTGTRSYNWVVPTPTKNKKDCLLKVVGFDSTGDRVASDNSNRPFVIEVARLVSPNGGETLTSGDYVTVTWQTHSTRNDVARTQILLTRDGGTTWSTEYAVEGNPGSFDWYVPVVQKLKKQCKLRVVLKDSHGKTVGGDTSNGYFSIQPSQ
jgi:hypothetical protein